MVDANALPKPILERLASEFEISLWADLIEPWFPRCFDPSGGFFQEFDFAWTPQAPQSRSAVFQARMTWVSSVLSELSHPRTAEFLVNANHGLDYLLDQFVEPDGAVNWLLGEEQASLGETNAYGSAFVLYALARGYKATGRGDVLAAAVKVFEWLEANAHDEQNGGYFETIGVDGQPIHSSSSGPERSTIHPRGVKTQNTLLHLMEAFAELARVWPDPRVLTRVTELLDIFRDRLFHAEGWLTAYVTSDWEQLAGPRSYGHDIESAHLMLDAASVLGRREFEATVPYAVAIVDNVCREGQDPDDGGFFYLGNSGGLPTLRTKSWWVQPEAMLGIATVLQARPERADLLESLEATWRWTRDRQLDHVRGGWIEDPARPDGPKGYAWKAAYHEARGLLYSSQILRGLAEASS